MKLLLSLILLSSVANAATHDLVFKKISENKKLSGKFTQERVIKSLDTRLNSSGTFSYDIGQKLVWNQQKPQSSEMIIYKDKIIQKMDGLPEQSITKKDKPSIFKINEIIFSILSGKAGQLKKLFNIKSTGNANKWEISLSPQKDVMKKIFTTIKLSGGQFIKTIILSETNGNSTNIKFDIAEKSIEK